MPAPHLPCRTHPRHTCAAAWLCRALNLQTLAVMHQNRDVDLGAVGVERAAAACVIDGGWVAVAGGRTRGARGTPARGRGGRRRSRRLLRSNETWIAPDRLAGDVLDVLVNGRDYASLPHAFSPPRHFVLCVRQGSCSGTTGAAVNGEIVHSQPQSRSSHLAPPALLMAWLNLATQMSCV